MGLVAGVDSSTQSTKVQVRDLDTGAVVAIGSAPHPPTTPPRSEQEPEAWWSAFRSAFDVVGTPAIEAISVTAQQHGMVALDAERRVVRPAKLWNDTESAPDADWLVRQLPGGAEAWAGAVGSVPVAAFTITKLSWLHRSEPDSWARVAHVVLPHDWMTFRLSGALVTDRGDASGTGYWSPSAGEYRWDLLGIIDRDRDWSDAVPRVLGPLEAAGEWGGAVVGPGTGDNMATALGLGLRPGDVVVSVGTSGTVFARCDAPTHDGSGAVAGFADATGSFLPLVCTLNAAKVLDATARLLGCDHQHFDELALSCAPGAGGLVLLPYFDGERVPNRPTATGQVAGLRSDVQPEQLARAAVEGVVCGLLDGLDALRAQGVSAARILLVGGGARSQAVRQVLADLAGVPVVVPSVEEAAATGAAVQAAAVLTGRSTDEVALHWGLGGGLGQEPSAAASAADEVRAAYGALRDRAGG
jgi:xylulokinase